VWKRVTTPEGVNHELGPWMRMTIPRGLRGATLEDVRPGVPLGRSWVFLFGVIPFDYDAMTIAEVGPGRRFLERSSMASFRSWQHERVVEPDGAGCTVTDRLTFEPRRGLAAVPGSRRLSERIVGAIFAHRHRRLAAHFAAATAGR
jgi:hypothetical protein